MRSSLAAQRLRALHSDIVQNQCAMPTSKMQPAARNRISKEIIRANIGNVLWSSARWGGERSGAFGESLRLTKTRTTFDWLRALKLNQWLIAARRQGKMVSLAREALRQRDE